MPSTMNERELLDFIRIALTSCCAAELIDRQNSLAKAAGQ
jgi:hypothetical protein